MSTRATVKQKGKVRTLRCCYYLKEISLHRSEGVYGPHIFQANSHWNMYQLDEISQEAHDSESYRDGFADLGEF